MEPELALRVCTAGQDTDDLGATRALAVAMSEAHLAWRAAPVGGAMPVKGGALLPTILLHAADATIRKALEVAASLFTRPGAPPVEIEVKTRDGEARVKFDPKRLDPARVAELVEALARATRPRPELEQSTCENPPVISGA